ncbi:hypothetical protein HanPI659440_Chr16g0627301 [Helianthus annuus]|nr:hypothetical protein HanPI659440_Chr16g0627301 [Helianthus annuus]
MSLNRGRSCNPTVVKVGIILLGVCLVGYLVGPPLYWHVLEGLAAVRRSSAAVSCHTCNCDCDSQPLLSIPQGSVFNMQYFTFIPNPILVLLFIYYFPPDLSNIAPKFGLRYWIL